ncbi:MAG: hypothetical protein ACLPIC_12960 [Rhodoblastus sp.]|uniref:hypothetical protein n=1 Tax=Rhodoblastus sp. TaxID=1962975 RepID=UPI003F9BE53A
MKSIGQLSGELQQIAGEIELKIHLGTSDAKHEWSELKSKLDHFVAQAQLEKSGGNVSEALTILGAELKDAFERIRSAL